MKILTNNILLYIFIMLISINGYADDPPEPCDGCPPVETAPIDENIILLVIAGITFGIYIIHKQNKKRPI